VALLLRSGFPEPALRLSGEARYVEHLLTRDAEQVDSGRDPARFRRYLEAYALNTAGVVDDKSLCDAAGINRKKLLGIARFEFHDGKREECLRLSDQAMEIVLTAVSLHRRH